MDRRGFHASIIGAAAAAAILPRVAKPTPRWDTVPLNKWPLSGDIVSMDYGRSGQILVCQADGTPKWTSVVKHIDHESKVITFE